MHLTDPQTAVLDWQTGLQPLYIRNVTVGDAAERRLLEGCHV